MYRRQRNSTDPHDNTEHSPGGNLPLPNDDSDCTHFVALNGKDTNGGKTIGDAFRTIGKGIGQIGTGDVLCIDGGTYHEPAISIKNDHQ